MMHVYNGILAIKRNEIRPFAATRIDLDIIIFSEVRQRKTNMIWYHLSTESKKWSQLTNLQNRNRDIENKLMVTKGEYGSESREIN